jgi:hypothetical protein
MRDAPSRRKVARQHDHSIRSDNRRPNVVEFLTRALAATGVPVEELDLRGARFCVRARSDLSKSSCLTQNNCLSLYTNIHRQE